MVHIGIGTPTGVGNAAQSRIAETRAAMAYLRDRWAAASPENPLWLCDMLIQGKSVADFCTDATYVQHMKRHQKSLNQKEIMEVALHGVPEQGVALGLPGPKGEPNDPFPFQQGWTPLTEAGRLAFQGTEWVPSDTARGAPQQAQAQAPARAQAPAPTPAQVPAPAQAQVPAPAPAQAQAAQKVAHLQVEQHAQQPTSAAQTTVASGSGAAAVVGVAVHADSEDDDDDNDNNDDTNHSGNAGHVDGSAHANETTGVDGAARRVGVKSRRRSRVRVRVRDREKERERRREREAERQRLHSLAVSSAPSLPPVRLTRSSALLAGVSVPDPGDAAERAGCRHSGRVGR